MAEHPSRLAPILMLCAAMFLSPTASSQDLSRDVQIDMAILALEESIIAREFTEILARIDALRGLDPESGQGELLFYEAEAALAQQDFDRAEPVLIRFLNEVGAASVNYQAALKLMMVLPAQRAKAQAAPDPSEAPGPREQAGQEETDENERAYLGVQIDNLSPELAKSFGLPDTTGVLVVTVIEGPASKAGLLAGDVILRLNGEILSNPAELARLIAELRLNAIAELMVVRDGQPLMMTAILGPGE